MSQREITRDGFSVRSYEDDEEVKFVECSYGGSMRERVEMGLMRNMNLDAYYVQDTRDGDEG